MRVRTIAGLIPLLPAVGLPRGGRSPRLGSGSHRGESWVAPGQPGRPGARARRTREHNPLGARPGKVRLALKEFLDEEAFLSPHGLRSVSKRYEAGRTFSRACRARRSTTSPPNRPPMFGGNSNWRGPVWMPVNYLAVREFVLLADVLRRRLHPRISDGRRGAPHFGEIAQELADRLVSIWLPDERRSPAGLRRYPEVQEDPAWSDNLPLLRVLPRRQRRRSRRHAPDRMDGTRRRPDPRSARIEPDAGLTRSLGKTRSPVGRINPRAPGVATPSRRPDRWRRCCLPGLRRPRADSGCAEDDDRRSEVHARSRAHDGAVR